MRVRPSAIETFQRCPLRWVLGAVGAEASPDATRTVGTAVHAVAQQVADGLPPADAPAALAAELDQLDLGPGWSDQRQRLSAQEMLDRFLRWHAANDRELVGAEVDFDVVVGRARIRGQVDRLERDGDGRLVVVDLKTGKTTAKNTEEHGQLAAYQVAVSAGAFADHGTVPGGAALLQVGTGREGQGAAPGAAARRRAAGRDLGRRARRAGGRGHGRGDVRGPHRVALLPLPDAPQLPAARARPAGDGMRPLFDDAQLSFDDLFARRRRRRRRHPGGCSTPPRWPPAAGCPTRPRPSRRASSRPRRTARSSWSRAPGRARPRRWPPGSPGWSPTGSWSPRRSSGSPSPARRPASSTSACGCGSARSPGTPRPSRSCATGWPSPSPPSRPTTATRRRWWPSTGCGSASSPAPASSARPCAGGRRRPWCRPTPATWTTSPSRC